MRMMIGLVTVIGLASCAMEQPPPSDGTFSSYPDYIRSQNGSGGNAGIAVAGTAGGIGGGIGGGITGAPISSGAIGSSVPVTTSDATGEFSVPAGIAVQTGEMAGLQAPPGISDEQDFSAVSSRETIESDRARLERQRAQYQQIAPTALPQRADDNGPNIVQYALATRNPKGIQVYNRTNPLRNSQFERSCGRYPSQDLAQQDFLRRGGPDRDPRSLDPDGDGFACRWDPSPFRSALN